MAEPSPTSQSLIDAISQTGKAAAQGWMSLLPNMPFGKELAAWMSGAAAEPERFAALQRELFENQSQLWRGMLARGNGDNVVPVVEAERGDRRFAGREWRDDAYFDYLRQSYLITAQSLNRMVEVSALDAPRKDRLRFAVKQWIDAMCPANFAATNPEAMRQAIESKGESITRGLANLIADSRRGRISMSDESVFEVGRNLAISPGAVVYENPLIQLIQYSPATAKVGKRPLVMVPPCINKFYILDLQPENSFVRYALEQGHTVFMVSWRNVKADLGHLTWDDYLVQGVIEALRTARAITGSERVNALGFCVGGTLLGAALAVLAAKRERLVESVTWLTTMLDFTETGQLGYFVDEANVAAREESIGGGGIFPGTDLAFVFSSLRANDLIWPYVVNNYLKGRTPDAFDLLYWNSDSTNLPGPMYCYYLRNTYLENRLRVPGALTNCGVPVDLVRIGVPSFVYGSREDHIVPWKSAYGSIRLLGGEVRFVLGASGHIAGVINPPSKNRRSYWSGDAYPEEPDAWLGQASETPGSWWPVWAQWLDRFKGRRIAARTELGDAQHRPIEPAPGRYVVERAAA
ncbi:MAG: class I poly(R)-hydroxyalkanoic acid synthase [Betaproteobacteria bacterium]|nr:class I poly(R)-hydroxyalkanoic acid synthase [Betaproteobacteria bacterium]